MPLSYMKKAVEHTLMNEIRIFNFYYLQHSNNRFVVYVRIYKEENFLDHFNSGSINQNHFSQNCAWRDSLELPIVLIASISDMGAN